jgi:hypothetical protein
MSRSENTKDFFKNHQDKFILTIGFILVCVISFAAGRLSITSKPEPVKIDESNIFEDIKSENTIEGEVGEDIVENNDKPEDKVENEGVFVGNIENNEFYPFNSEEVGDIVPDNMIWFDSQEEAEEQGYALAKTNKSATKSENSNTSLKESAENCKYVGSKNSDKYHLPDSGTAKNIKEENKVCFSSKEEAESKGYTAGSSVK